MGYAPFLTKDQISKGHTQRERNGAYAKSSLLNARKTVKEAKYPVFSPTVWHVEAYVKLSGERRVRAHPKFS
jgi:hypothetical protein